MKYCTKCGNERLDDAVICTRCGCAVYEKRQIYPGYVPPKARCARILGLLSLILVYPLGILAIVFAILSREDSGGKMCSQAAWGMAFGITALCLWGINMWILS